MGDDPGEGLYMQYDFSGGKISEKPKLASKGVKQRVHEVEVRIVIVPAPRRLWLRAPVAQRWACLRFGGARRCAARTSTCATLQEGLAQV